jgi:hypothetical protein
MLVASLITALFGGVAGAWAVGVPPLYSALTITAALVVVLVTKGAELIDARTRRFQAETERMTALRHCSKCETNGLSPPAVQVASNRAEEPPALSHGKKRKRSAG